ncbi:alpha/beta hydrolase [Rhizobium sp. KVB221]|uniref:Alpha/beta hydrolase n=1 Tax=Rhizobium setariae TaxID=2801340 RepID=A0A937CN14_9HYPH|nr:alpha/beta hydrolase [Rhizobium setariae]MBL0374960.1 alpha/beta hydrolase [Rhizobium setariae]
MTDQDERPHLKSLSVGQQRFDYFDVGSGMPVVFLHGALGDVRTFEPHCRMLAAQCRAITYTQRYFGTADWPEDGPPFGIEAHARDLIAFIEAIDPGPVLLVAWSYAGHAALRAGQLRPELFRAMLIYETGFQTFMTDEREIAAFKADLEPMFGPIFGAVKEGRLEDAARLLIDGSAGEDGYFDRQSEASRRIELENAPMMPRLLAQTPPPKISAEDLRALQVGITIACGERSRPAYKLVSEAAMRILPGPHHMIPGANHFWPDENPEAFCVLVRDWLEAVAPSDNPAA